MVFYPLFRIRKNNAAASVNTAEYSATTSLIVVAVFIPFALAEPRKIIRSDGTRLVLRPAESSPKEINNTVYALKEGTPFILRSVPSQRFQRVSLQRSDTLCQWFDIRYCRIHRWGQYLSVRSVRIHHVQIMYDQSSRLIY